MHLESCFKVSLSLFRLSRVGRRRLLTIIFQLVPPQPPPPQPPKIKSSDSDGSGLVVLLLVVGLRAIIEPTSESRTKVGPTRWRSQPAGQELGGQRVPGIALAVSRRRTHAKRNDGKNNKIFSASVRYWQSGAGAVEQVMYVVATAEEVDITRTGE